MLSDNSRASGQSVVSTIGENTSFVHSLLSAPVIRHAQDSTSGPLFGSGFSPSSEKVYAAWFPIICTFVFLSVSRLWARALSFIFGFRLADLQVLDIFTEFSNGILVVYGLFQSGVLCTRRVVVVGPSFILPASLETLRIYFSFFTHS